MSILLEMKEESRNRAKKFEVRAAEQERAIRELQEAVEFASQSKGLSDNESTMEDEEQSQAIPTVERDEEEIEAASNDECQESRPHFTNLEQALNYLSQFMGI